MSSNSNLNPLQKRNAAIGGICAGLAIGIGIGLAVSSAGGPWAGISVGIALGAALAIAFYNSSVRGLREALRPLDEHELEITLES